METLTIGNTTVRTRPHIGCGSCPVIYDIMDGDQVVRSQISKPGATECREAVRAHRYQVEQAKRDAVIGPKFNGGRAKAAKKARGVTE